MAKSDQDFIRTLSTAEQEFVHRFREFVADLPHKPLQMAILLDGEVVPTDMSVAIMWQIRYPHACRVAESWVRNHRISTVFVPTNLNLGGEIPMHFETKVFPPDSSLHSHLDCTEHYRTLQQAIVGHTQVVRIMEDRLATWPMPAEAK